MLNPDEMSLAAELCLGAAALRPTAYATRMAKLLVDYCVEHDLFCVAPRGLVLARLAVQLLTLADDHELHRRSCGSLEDSPVESPPSPKTKCRRLESAGDGACETAASHLLSKSRI